MGGTRRPGLEVVPVARVALVVGLMLLEGPEGLCPLAAVVQGLLVQRGQQVREERRDR